MIPPARRIAYIAVSTDGLIADRHGQIGWLEQFGAAADFGFDDFLSSVDALVMGRRTFDQVAGFGGAWPYGSRPTLVLTHRPLPPNAPASARAASEEELTQALLGAPGRIWIVGGGATLAFCLRRGLLDELTIFVMPILLGEGAPLIGRINKAARLTHTRTEALAHGVTKLSYAVEGAGATETPAVETPAAEEPIQPEANVAAEGLSATPNPDEDASDDAPLVDPYALWPFPSEANAEKDA
jgi:dihydrofolate reductase